LLLHVVSLDFSLMATPNE